MSLKRGKSPKEREKSDFFVLSFIPHSFAVGFLHIPYCFTVHLLCGKPKGNGKNLLSLYFFFLSHIGKSPTKT